ncbi:MAG TPA: hypothetical protein VFA15_00940 [Nitrososphaera sp.]|nr:hypothetical protein [Nitrososphaera sp.]
MVNWFRFRYRLQKVLRNKDRLERSYLKAIRQAEKKPKHPYEADELWAEFFSEKAFYDDEINSLVTGHLCEMASQLMLPVPEHEEKGMWQEAEHRHNRWVLSVKGAAELRAAIRKEQRESREQFVIWASLLTGIIGALTGLISILIR